MAQGNRIKIFQGRDPHTKFSANPLSLYHNEGCSYSYSSVRGVIQDVFLYHSSITPKTWYFYHITENQPIDIFFLSKSI